MAKKKSTAAPKASKASKIAGVRLGPLYDAVEAKRKERGFATISDYIRDLIVRDTGAPMPEMKEGGFANMAVADLAEASAAGVEERHGIRPKKSAKKKAGRKKD